MNKKYKKLIKNVILGICVLAMVSSVTFATRYTSTLKLSARSTHAGSTRSYKGSTHKIALKVSWRDYGGGSSDNYCKINLVEKTSRFRTRTRKRGQLNLKTVGRTYTMKTRNQKNGDFYYTFNNRYSVNSSKASKIDSFECDKVTMSSY